MSHAACKSSILGGVFLVAVAAIFLSPKTASAQISTDHLVITEVQTGLEGTGNTTKDFIEIYNPTNTDIDLDGYRLVKRTKNGTSDTSIKSWTTSAIIPAKTYYLWANSAYAEIAADVTTTQTIANDNAVALRQGPVDTGTIIDAVGWGENATILVEGSVFTQNIPDGQSLERIAETNNNSSDFQLQVTPSPRGLSAGSVDEPQPEPEEDSTDSSSTFVEPIPQVFISEFLPNPKGLDSGSEWAELVNTGSVLVDLAGWVLDDEGTYVPEAGSLSLSGVIEPGAYKVFLIPSSKFAINNDSDMIRLFLPGGSLRDIISFSSKSEEGRSFAKDASGVWRWTEVPTPGLANQFIISAGPESDNVKPNDNVEADDKYANIDIVFSEVFGNPKGADEGEEWIEFLNRGKEDYDIAGWFVDDEGKTLSSNAYAFPTGSLIPAGGTAAFKLPLKSFTITNTGDELRLLSPDKSERAEVIVPALSDDQSYARVDEASQIWQLSMVPTFGAKNKFTTSAKQVGIQSVRLASKGELNTINLTNLENDWVDLSFWVLRLGEKEYVFPDKASIAPRGELTLHQDVTGLNFTSKNWKELTLLRPEREVQATAELAILLDQGTSTSEPKKVVISKQEPPIQGLVAGDSSSVDDAQIESSSDTSVSPKKKSTVIIDNNTDGGFFHSFSRFICRIAWFLC